MNPRKNTEQENHPELEHCDFDRLIEPALSRRTFLQTSAAALGLYFATTPVARAVAAATRSPLLGFEAVAASTADGFAVPAGYVARPLISWGDPLLPGAPAFNPSGTQDAAAQAAQFGDNTDGMSLFPLAEDRAVLAVNNEYTNYEYLYAHQGEAELSADDVKKAQAAHGVSVFEIARNRQGDWQPVAGSRYNRRITAYTPMEVTGPAAGHALLKTAADASGRKVLGTFNNCANGRTPWGTYLTCEENFHGYFGSADAQFSPDRRQKRYGLAAKSDYRWFGHDERFDLARHPNEPHRHGWVVEIDPLDPASTPRKRTALGRFKHENAELIVAADGHVVVYLGDDERGEHIYRFVSKGRYDPANPAANRELLAEGTLYVARFGAEPGELKGRGEWIELTHGKNGLTAANGFADQAEVLVFAREAATRVGATTMDRPEWVAIHPDGRSVYCTLTNNSKRGSDGQPVSGPNPRAANKYGQIVRWRPAGGDHTVAGFEWDLFVLAGNPAVHGGTPYAGSANVSADNMFNSPDGIGFDADGRLWIQTDGDYSNAGDFAGMGNNQMLCADPASGEIRRFATGPVACELTGMAFTPDRRTLFVGVQHPGEDLKPSHFPGGGSAKPRSTIMAIRRIDGGVVGT
ncbi:PhoX family protein [Pseudothauera rhizosphaerae]|uniref:PhoX family phosphatase n=1 Tax=Pseudothauera rhizosphaerae TaxID=2565932 RepID=A0A4S4ADU3_9RHOO|nr:PhoX family phosphatase [Pseudothauera rhizosphaerae]THF57245.1 PhoX family phosphatase [Pseudothauera rhizosphaerae]